MVLKLTASMFSSLVLAALALIFDGYDTQVIAYVMPQIQNNWRAPVSELKDPNPWRKYGLIQL